MSKQAKAIVFEYCIGTATMQPMWFIVLKDNTRRGPFLNEEQAFEFVIKHYDCEKVFTFQDITTGVRLTVNQ